MTDTISLDYTNEQFIVRIREIIATDYKNDTILLSKLEELFKAKPDDFVEWYNTEIEFNRSSMHDRADSYNNYDVSSSPFAMYTLKVIQLGKAIEKAINEPVDPLEELKSIPVRQFLYPTHEDSAFEEQRAIIEIFDDINSMFTCYYRIKSYRYDYGSPADYTFCTNITLDNSVFDLYTKCSQQYSKAYGLIQNSCYAIGCTSIDKLFEREKHLGKMKEIIQEKYSIK